MKDFLTTTTPFFLKKKKTLSYCLVIVKCWLAHNGCGDDTCRRTANWFVRVGEYKLWLYGRIIKLWAFMHPEYL